MWEVSTTIHAPEAAHELGDHVTIEVMQLPTNRIERVRSDAALDQAKKTIDGIVRDGAAAAELTRSEST